MSDNKNLKNMTLKERFDNRGFAVKKYATAYGISHTILSMVLSGERNGRNNINGDTRKIIAQLKKDKVWIGKLPWEV
ncbi:hypothetical protein L5F42_03225 [Aliarcobacter butzleri]|uniref:hypothetical protein n=1 Tax=Aliarcobacter butzleri TaxID=28197 RepID=UPI001EE07D71|nr:hypothetical protein [Aliarcobacter butzleri]MCG3698848.1 hypothetical protein [Aliarcobacter butzleri]